MAQVRVHNFSISLDGFATGERQCYEAPFGHAGRRLHQWLIASRFGADIMGQPGGSSGMDDAFAQRHETGIGAKIMGRGKFRSHSGPWTDVGADDEWRGCWGPNPPFQTPVFALTHYSRPSIEMEGGAVFHFVDATPAEALDLAKDAAEGKDVRIGGGCYRVGMADDRVLSVQHFSRTVRDADSSSIVSDLAPRERSNAFGPDRRAIP